MSETKYIIQKAINNNVVSCVDDNGHEVIVMGRGLGFHAKSGLALPTEMIEKTFYMEKQNDLDSLKNLLASVPTEQIEVCHRIISYAKETLDCPLRETLYLTLTDHIHFAIFQKENGRSFPNALLTEVRTFYPREYLVSKYAIDLIRNELGVSLPEDEAASIALHIVNAEYDGSLSETMKITQTLHEIVTKLSEYKGITIQQQSIFFDEFIVSLKFLVIRCYTGEEYEEGEDDFITGIQHKFSAEFDCAEWIAEILEQQSGHHVSKEDIAVLAILIHRAGRKTSEGKE